MKILVVGSGGREHALASKLAQSSAVERVFCAPGNGGTSEVAENVAIAAAQLPELAVFAKQNRIDLTVIGPDDPLAAGIVDLFQSEKLPVFGPNKSAARLEASKIFSKEIMLAAGVPTARARTFTASADALSFIDRVELPVVVKADGLALGKGVVIAQERASAREAVRAMMEGQAFGEAGQRVVIEECLRGSECSVHALVSGADFQVLGTARDHKRALDGDLGPNTGGMGAVSPADNWNEECEIEFREKVIARLFPALAKSGATFRGLLFPGLMLTPAGLRVLEFNCRFGDPETQAILPRLRSDLLPLLFGTVQGDVTKAVPEWDQRAAVTVILASGGYPGKYETGKRISGLATAAGMSDVHIFHAGTKRVGGELVTSGGRVLAVTALGETREAARARAYAAAGEISFEGCHYRRDIALAPVTHNIAP